MASRDQSGSGSYLTAAYQSVQAMQGSADEVAAGVVVYHLFQLLRSAEEFGRGHKGLRTVSVEFSRAIAKQARLLGEPTIRVEFTGAGVQVNGRTVAPAAAEYARSRWLLRKTVRAGVVALEMDEGITPNEVGELSDRFSDALNLGDPLHQVDDLPHISVTTQEPNPAFDEQLKTLYGLGRYPLLQLYAEGIARTMEWARLLNQSQRPSPIAAKRVVGQVVDALHADRGGMVGMILMRPLPATFSNRRFDTAILSIGLALEMGLDDGAAREVGVTALLRPLPPRYGPWWTREPVDPRTAATIAALGGNELETITSFETAPDPGLMMPAEYYGEPMYRHVASMILTAAEAFVDMLQPDDSSSPFSPEMAIQMMVASSGTRFDAEIVRGLTSLLGVYPPGTPVRLNSGDLAVVTSSPPDGADPRRPAVRPLDTTSRDVYRLWRPELSTYSIVESVAKLDCPINPDFIFLL